MTEDPLEPGAERPQESMDDFDARFAPALEELRFRRGVCPESGRLLDLSADTLEPAQRRQIEDHLALCPGCTDLLERIESEPAPESLPEEIDDPTWRRTARRLDRRRLPWVSGRPSSLPLLALAASLLLALGAAGWWLALDRTDRAPRAGPVSTVRGAEIQLLRPLRSPSPDTEGPIFEWSTVLPLELTYRLEVEHEGAPLLITTTASERYRPTPDELGRLARVSTFRWRVVGLDGEGDPVTASAWRTVTAETAAP